MVGAVSPDWLGSPQHVIVGAIAAVGVYFVARSRRFALPEWLAFVLAVSLVCTAELAVELVEYPLLYADHFHAGAYYDTLADMASSIVGAIVGAALAIPLRRRFP